MSLGEMYLRAEGSRQMAMALFANRHKMKAQSITYPLKNGWRHDQIRGRIKIARRLDKQYRAAQVA